MKQFYTVFAIFLFVTGAAFAQGTAADTTFYTDEQGRTVMLIKQKQGTPAPQQSVRPAGAQTFQDASLTRDSTIIYQERIDKYSKSAQSFRTKGNVFLWSGLGVAVIGIGLMIANISSSDFDSSDDCKEYDDGSYYCSNVNDVSPGFVVGYVMTIGGAAMTTTGIILKIVGGSKNKKAVRNQGYLDSYMARHTGNATYSLRLIPSLDVEHKAAGASLAFGF